MLHLAQMAVIRKSRPPLVKDDAAVRPVEPTVRGAREIDPFVNLQPAGQTSHSTALTLGPLLRSFRALDANALSLNGSPFQATQKLVDFSGIDTQPTPTTYPLSRWCRMIGTASSSSSVKCRLRNASIVIA